MIYHLSSKVIFRAPLTSLFSATSDELLKIVRRKIWRLSSMCQSRAILFLSSPTTIFTYYYEAAHRLRGQSGSSYSLIFRSSASVVSAFVACCQSVFSVRIFSGLLSYKSRLWKFLQCPKENLKIIQTWQIRYLLARTQQIFIHGPWKKSLLRRRVKKLDYSKNQNRNAKRPTTGNVIVWKIWLHLFKSTVWQ